MSDEMIQIPNSQIMQILNDITSIRTDLRELKTRVDGTASTDSLMTVKQVAQELNYTEETVRRRQRSKSKDHLPAVKGMRPLRFRRNIVQSYKMGKRGTELYADD